MEQEEAVALIGAAVMDVGGTWADLGAGTGTFTRALASLIGASGVVYAVDQDAHALRTLSRAPQDAANAAIRTVVGDFTEAVELPPLDGVVLANALHFVPYADQARVLRQVARLPDGACADHRRRIRATGRQPLRALPDRVRRAWQAGARV